MTNLRNSKLLIFSLVFFLIPTILGLNLFYFASVAAYPYFVHYGDITCGYRVYPCNTDLFRSDINIHVLNNIIMFNQIESCYCSPPISDPEFFTIEIEVLGNNITIKEIYSAQGNFSRCICDYSITGGILISSYGFYYLNFIFISEYFNQTKILGIFYIDLDFP